MRPILVWPTCPAGIRNSTVVFDQLIAFFNVELFPAIGTPQLNIRMPEILVMHVETFVALRAGRIEVFDHLCFLWWE